MISDCSGFELWPQVAKPCRLGYPLNRLRITTKLFIDGRCWAKTKFRISSRFPAFQFVGRIGRVRFPTDLPIVCHQREPGEPVMRSHLGVIKAVLPIAPGTEDQRRMHMG